MKSIAIAVVILISFLKANSVFAGLGISPSQMLVDNLLPGAHLEKTFVFSRSNYQEDLHFKVNIAGTNKDWVIVDRGDEFIVPAGEERFSIVVMFDVPQDTPVGDYSGSIRFVPQPNVNQIGPATGLSAFIQTDFKIVDKTVLTSKVGGAETIVHSKYQRMIVSLVFIFLVLIASIIIILYSRVKHKK